MLVRRPTGAYRLEAACLGGRLCSFIGLISPFARVKRLNRIISKAITRGRNPGPGLPKVPGFSLIPPTAKNISTAVQKRLPTTPDSNRFTIISSHTIKSSSFIFGEED
jgi:hypothetical protein